MIFLLIFIIALILAFWFLGGRELIGEWLIQLFPKDYLRVGDKVEVFLNGEHNRTATITAISQDKLFIYDTIPLPLNYRGPFYATGVDQNDGSKIIYIKTWKHYKLVRVAELIKKLFNFIGDQDNLPPAGEAEFTKDFVETEEEIENEL